MSTCIFTWFSEPLNHKRRFSTFLHNKTKETKEEEGIYTEYIPLVSNFYPRTFDLYTKIAISRPIFLSKEGEGPKEILTKHLSEVRVRSTEVVLFGSFLRICHCAKLMERLGLAALLCRGAFFARRRGRVSFSSSPRLLFSAASSSILLLFLTNCHRHFFLVWSSFFSFHLLQRRRKKSSE